MNEFGPVAAAMRDKAVEGGVGVLTSGAGLKYLGFPLNTLMYWLLYLTISTLLGLLAAFATEMIKRIIGPSASVGIVTKTLISGFVTACMSLGLLLVAQAVTPPTAITSVATGAGSPVRAGPVKALRPRNVDVCDPGTPEPFTSLAADLGASGLGEQGVPQGIHYTSCGFARNVRAKYFESYAGGPPGPVSATSPAAPELGAIYMTCWTVSSSMIECDGGQDAHVYIY